MVRTFNILEGNINFKTSGNRHHLIIVDTLKYKSNFGSQFAHMPNNQMTTGGLSIKFITDSDMKKKNILQSKIILIYFF